MNMETLSRRDFTRHMLGSLFTFSLVSTLCEARVLTGNVKPIAHRWVAEMEQVTRALRDGMLKPIEWQRQIETLLARVQLSDLLRAIDYERLAKAAVFPADHESAEEVNLSKIEGLPSELSFAPFFYAMQKGVAIVPHGHRNMTSMHMVLKGKAHGWQYDRVADEAQHLIIQPTQDKLLVPGDVSTISDEKDNVHWFKAMTEPVFMFNIGVFGVNPGASFTGRDYVDPVRGEKMKDGLIRAKRLNVDEAYKLYGKS
jgi:hypothetical protein